MYLFMKSAKWDKYVAFLLLYDYRKAKNNSSKKKYWKQNLSTSSYEHHILIF